MAEAVHAGTRGEYHRTSRASSRSTWISISDRSTSSTIDPGTRCSAAPGHAEGAIHHRCGEPLIRSIVRVRLRFARPPRPLLYCSSIWTFVRARLGGKEIES